MKVVNKREMAAILGVAERTLTEWQREGLPFVKGSGRGASNHYRTPDVIAWMIARQVKASPAGESARDRLARVQGDLVELELARKTGELVPVAEIKPAYLALVVAARQTLLQMPARLAPLVATMDDVDGIRELLDEQVHDALTNLAGSDGAPAGGDDGGPSPGVVTAGEGAPVAMGRSESRTAGR